MQNNIKGRGFHNSIITKQAVKVQGQSIDERHMLQVRKKI